MNPLLTDSPHRRILSKFIEIYKSEPCLWKVSSIDYHNRIKKENAYSKLLKTLKTIEPEADRKAVIRKITVLRQYAKKEEKKYEKYLKSKKSARREPPDLWYYNQMSFLNQAEEAPEEPPVEPIASVTMEANTTRKRQYRKILTIDGMQYINHPAIYQDDSGPMSTEESTPTTQGTSLLIKDLTPSPGLNITDKEEPDQLNYPSNQEDRCDIFGKLVAAKLRGLENRRRLIAEKLINDVLFEAETGNPHLIDLNFNDLLSQDMHACNAPGMKTGGSSSFK